MGENFIISHQKIKVKFFTNNSKNSFFHYKKDKKHVIFYLYFYKYKIKNMSLTHKYSKLNYFSKERPGVSP
ncbi:hypothetical protein I2400191J7_25520 [Ruminococcus bicirculans (ex Wegman et al. 2014)]